MIAYAFTRLLEKAINTALALDFSKAGFLEFYNGKVVKIILQQPAGSFYLVINTEKIYVYQLYDDKPDTIIRGPSIAFFKQFLSLKGRSDLAIEGNTELAHQLALLLQNIDIDWEEYLAFFTNDVVARQLGDLWRKLKKATLHTGKRTAEDFFEYLVEEQRYLPTREEVEDFYEDIAELKTHIERLEARINRLRNSS